MAKKQVKNVKEEFTQFASKVAEIESLKKELAALDTKGFEKEAEIIRAKFNNIDKVLEVRKEVNDLEEKIKNKSLRHHEIGGATRKALSHSLNKINLLEKNISELKEVILKKKKISLKKQLNKEEIRYVQDVPKLEKNLEIMQEEFSGLISSLKIKLPHLEDELMELRKEFDKHAHSTSLQRKINELKEIILSNKPAKIRQPITIEEAKHVKELPHLEENLAELRKEFDKHAHSTSLQRKINELKEIISKKKLVYAKPQLTKRELDYISDIPSLEEEIAVLREELGKHESNRFSDAELLKDKIMMIEAAISKEKTERGPQLKKEEIDYIDELPNIEKGIQSLRGDVESYLSENASIKDNVEGLKREIEDKSKTSYDKIDLLKQELENYIKTDSTKVDLGVGSIVDIRFSHFISEIKEELSEKFREKEAVMDAQFKIKLEQQDKYLDKRMHDLEKELEAKYEKKVGEELEKEVKEKFNSMLEDRVEEKRLILDKEFKEKLKKEKDILESQLNARFLEESEKMERDMKLKMNQEKEESEARVRQKIKEEHDRIAVGFERKISEEKQKLDEEFRNKFEDEKNRIKLFFKGENERKLEHQKEQVIENLEAHYAQKERQMREDFNGRLEREVGRIFNFIMRNVVKKLTLEQEHIVSVLHSEYRDFERRLDKSRVESDVSQNKRVLSEPPVFSMESDNQKNPDSTHSHAEKKIVRKRENIVHEPDSVDKEIFYDTQIHPTNMIHKYNLEKEEKDLRDRLNRLIEEEKKIK